MKKTLVIFGTTHAYIFTRRLYNPVNSGKRTKLLSLKQYCGSESAFILVAWIRIRIQKGKYYKITKFQVLKCWLFSYEGRRLLP